MSDKFYVTTPIYYPSGRFYIGTAYTEVVADSMKRYHVLKGEESYMLTGTDEHGQKIEQKSKEDDKTKLESVMYHLIENLRKIAILIEPFMPNTADEIFRQIGIEDEDLKNWKLLKEYTKLQDISVISKGEPIFMRLNPDEEIEYIKEAMKNN